MDPINRSGRHWCNPASEGSVEFGTVATCPECGTVWEFQETTFGGFWVKREDEG